MTPQLLGLIGRQSYLFCDITGAYDDLLALPAEEGFSKQVLEGRRELLDLVKEAIIFAEGKVQADRAVNIPMSLLPSALVLLTQVGMVAGEAKGAANGRQMQNGVCIPCRHHCRSCTTCTVQGQCSTARAGHRVLLFALHARTHGTAAKIPSPPLQIDQHDLVMDLAPPLLENWEVRKAFKRDILLALALACCGCARDMFAAEQVCAHGHGGGVWLCWVWVWSAGSAAGNAAS